MQKVFNKLTSHYSFSLWYFENPKDENHTLKLYNTQGQLVWTITNITTDQVIIYKDELAGGLYFFELRTDKQIRISGKLTIK